VLKIAKEEGVDSGTVSSWLKKLGLDIKQGQHFVGQPSLNLSPELVDLLSRGPTEVRKLVTGRIWGVQPSANGIQQLEKFCGFIELYRSGNGVEETSRDLRVHRTTVTKWRNGADQPYLVKLATVSVIPPSHEGWMTLPMTISSGGNAPEGWYDVPTSIQSYDSLVGLLGKLRPLETTFARAARFGLDRSTVELMMPEFFAYLLGFMLGDASKLGGTATRFTSVNIDLQLSLKHDCNLRLGEFVCMCMNSIGLDMDGTADKQPTGDSKFAQVPTGAYRWNSERSPLLAWIVSVCMGLKQGQTTSLDPVQMEWIFTSPRVFRKRFIQALADSDATVKPYEVVVTSTPNADFTTRLLQSLGMTSAHTINEKGRPLKSMVSRREAMRLPIFNEFVKGYRYDKLNLPFRGEGRTRTTLLPQPSRLGPSE